MADRAPKTPTHTEHDLLLVAALVDRDLTAAEAETARAQVEACDACASLHAELTAIARATAQLPPIARPRDFTLRPADAQRLRPSLVRRILGSFGTARDGFSRPLAMGLTTLGLAGLLVGVVPGALSIGAGGAASAPGANPELYQSPISAASPAAGLPAASEAPAGEPSRAGETIRDYAAESQGQDPGQGQTDAAGGGTIARPMPNEDGDNFAIAGEDDLAARLSEDASGVSQLIVISGTLLIVGLGLFAIRWASRRFG